MTQTKTRSRAPELDAALLRRLKLSREVAEYMVSRGIPLPDCPPRFKTPEPRGFKGAKFKPEAVDRVLKAFHLLRHTKGKWAGRPLDPDPWQVAYVLAPVFGWQRFDKEAGRWIRVIRSAYVDVPRKNGKSTLAGGVSVYMIAADGEMGAEGVTAATTKEQAGFVFAPLKLLCEKSPALKGNVSAYAQKIVHKASGSYFQPIANVADAQHGANIHVGVIDELHVHKTPDLVEAIETGTGSRDQPLIVIITTADDGAPGTIYARKRDRIEKLAKRVLKDPTTYGVIWAADEKDDPFDVETQRRANPGYGISPTAAYLANAANEAKDSPAQLATYLRLHLGLRTKQTTKYVSLKTWDDSAGMVVESRLKGRKAYGGLDLSSVEDVTALCWEFPDGRGSVDALWRFWLPEARMDAMNKRTAGEAEVWRRQGFLTLTPGNVIDLDYVYNTIIADAALFDVKTIGFDRWGANPLVTRLGDDGMTCVPRGQGFATTTAPMKDILRLLLGMKLRHGGNPVMRWMTDNLAVAMDPGGNVKPDKAKAADKIDGWSALVNAHGEAMDNEAIDEPTPAEAPQVENLPKAVSYTADLSTAGF